MNTAAITAPKSLNSTNFIQTSPSQFHQYFETGAMIGPDVYVFLAIPSDMAYKTYMDSATNPYPRWLSVIAAISFGLIATGLLTAFFKATYEFSAAIVFGFLGVWLTDRLSRKYKPKNLV